jgi:hypothetical protein
LKEKRLRASKAARARRETPRISLFKFDRSEDAAFPIWKNDSREERESQSIQDGNMGVSDEW